MVTTPNRGYELQATGANNGTWGVILNSQVFSVIDLNFGGALTIDVSGSSDVTVSEAQARNAFINLTGTLAGNINLIIPSQGASYVIRNGTSGNFSITVKQSGGTGVTVAQGFTTAVFNNTSGGETVYRDSSRLAVDGGRWSGEVNVTAASTTDILGAASFRTLINGAGATITSLGTNPNCLRLVRFNGVNTLVYNGTSLIIPGAANITTASGDTMVVCSDGSGNARVYAYTRANGQVVSYPAGGIVQRRVARVVSGMSTSAVIPVDNTLPQIGEGAECISATITPTKIGNAIDVTFQTFGSIQITAPEQMAFFPFAMFVSPGPDAFSAFLDGVYFSGLPCTPSGFGTFTVADLTTKSVSVRYGVAGPGGTAYLNGLPTLGKLFTTAGGTTLILEERWV